MNEDAPEWCALDQAMAQARIGFADLPTETVAALADEAVAAARKARKAAAKTPK